MILAAVLLVCSCSEKKESRTKAPIRVKMQVVSPSMADNRVTYVGIVEEREGTAVSFTGMGVVKRLLVNEGQAVLITLQVRLGTSETQEHVEAYWYMVLIVCDIEAYQFVALVVLALKE